MQIPRPLSLAGPAVLTLLLSVSAAVAQEPTLALENTGADLRVLLDGGAADRLLWNLYRGDLSDLPAYLQHGDPEGRCSVDGAASELLLVGELSQPANSYYLLTERLDDLSETSLGLDSVGNERPNTDPCPAPGTGCGTAGTGGPAGTTFDETMDVLGVQRTYHRHVPDDYDPSKTYPLLIFYHGLGSNLDQAYWGYGMVALAEQNDFIVLFPDSLTLPGCPAAGKHWDVCESQPDVNTSQDIVFTRQLIEETSALYNVCETNIYTHGHSFGAFFSFYVAMTLPDQVAAFAAHSGGMSVFAPGFCWPRCVPAGIRKVPGFLLHSTDDSVVSYDSSVEFDSELLAAGHESYFVTLTGQGHSFDQSYNQQTWDWFLARGTP